MREALLILHLLAFPFLRPGTVAYLGGSSPVAPPWNSRGAIVPGLRKENASRCNIKKASLMGAPSQPLRGARVEGGGVERAPPRTPLTSVFRDI